MGVSTNLSITTFPRVPDSLKMASPELFDYLNQHRLVLQQIVQGHFTAINGLTTVINNGTSGSYSLTSIGHIFITSGVITTITTT